MTLHGDTLGRRCHAAYWERLALARAPGLIGLAVLLAVLALIGIVGWSLWVAPRQNAAVASLPSRQRALVE